MPLKFEWPKEVVFPWYFSIFVTRIILSPEKSFFDGVAEVKLTLLVNVLRVALDGQKKSVFQM